jgi:hypothetical protein
MTTRRSIRLALTLVLLAPSARGAGDDVGSLVRRGVELRRVDRNEEALALFEQAAKLSSKPSVHGQLALAEQAVGRWADAERDLDTVLAATDDPWVTKNESALERARDLVRHHLGWLLVDVDDVAALELRFDGEPIARGVETRVVARTAPLEVRAPGFAPDVRTVVVIPGEHLHVAMTLVPLVATPAPAAVSPEPEPVPLPAPAQESARALEAVARPASSRPTGPIVVGVLGLAGAATGSILGIRAIQEKNSESEASQSGRPASAATSYADAKTSSIASTIAFGAAAALLATAGTWWFVTRDSSHGSKRTIAVAPVVGGDMGGVLVRGEW